MNKDVLVLLLQKDIEELALLTKGFEAMTVFPESLLKLARTKAEHVLHTLHELEDLPLHQAGEAKLEISVGTQQPMSEAPATPDMPEQTNELRPEMHETNPSDNEVHAVIMPDRQEAPHIIPTEDHPATAMPAEEDTRNQYEHTPTKETSSGVALNDTLAGEDNSVSNSLSNQKIEDIRLAINIGDRFRFQRELFDGNGETLNKTISYLNQLAHYTEAERFLKSKFGWSNDNPHAEEFLKIVKRRYLS